MNFQIAVLCDAASETSGKLSLLGAFDTIYATQLPAIHAQCSIALRMTFTSGEEGVHKMRLSFVDADGKFFLPAMDLPMQVEIPPETHFVTRSIIVHIQQLRFDRPGLYAVDLSVDDRQEGSIPLTVKYNPPKPPEAD